LTGHRVISIAHRGDPRAHRENTIPAMLAGIAQGADPVEIDLEVTADDQLILLHDADLVRLWGHPARAAELTLAEIHTACPGEYRVPTFAELLDLQAATGAGVMVDVDEPPLATRALAEVVRRGLLGTTLFAGAYGAMRAIRDASAGARIALSLDTLAELPAAGELRALAPEYLNPHWPVLDAALVQRWHGEGYGLSCWTVDSPSTMAYLMDLGVDVIISNRIGQLVELIAASGATVPTGAARQVAGVPAGTAGRVTGGVAGC
jgi:glycerophosphoryl diester phosphodiesterase